MMRSRGPMASGFLVVLALILAGAVACVREPSPTPPTPVPVAPKPGVVAKPPPALGMKVGERFHEVHASKAQLKCDSCHAKGSATYNDPLAQVVNQVDSRACLSCHKEGGSQPFYGEEWNKAKVGR